jgi:hypothetical protein
MPLGRANIHRAMPAQTRISAPAVAEIKTVLGAHCEAVRNSELSLSSQATYVDMVNSFVRWLNYDFEPGSRVAPYKPKKDKKDTTA